ncbi:DUF1707 domain-containing protein [Nakamurella sp. YIM 132087]|uniref:DUF1707 domain-containing protein n=1 Tax=Nakamurella alba TaxID=2665158 RepID=A0A7K1FJ58_9ACTN|nr:DUF1707 domain-containing protein [Nakamurella alba]MTD14171.1 DUF1707 domain-containing protein [Nakamurella alba]
MSAPDAGSPADPDPTELRVGDADRNAAVDALSQHLSAGRLDLDEFGTRSAQINTARTAREITAVFADLPAPHPTLSTAVAPPAPVQRSGGIAVPPPRSPAVGDDRSTPQKIVAGVSAVSGVVAVILFFALQGVWAQAWLVFLMIPAVGLISNAIWGDDKDKDRRERD